VDADARPTPTLAGILVSRRRPTETDRTLGCAFAQSMPPASLVVVNVEADDETERVVRAWAARRPEVRYLPIRDNVGPAGAVAAGVDDVLRHVPDADYVVLFEDDEPPTDADAVARLVDHLAGQPEGARVGGVGYHGARFSRVRAVLRRPDTPPGAAADVDYVAGGSCPVFRRELLADVGGYDPALFFGLEELEFGLRARARGWRLQILGRPPAPHHAIDAARHLSRRSGWSWRKYYSLRNLLVILLRHHQWFALVHVALLRGVVRPLTLLPRGPRDGVRQLRYNLAAIRDALTGRLGVRVAPDDPPLAG
jgi:GT2 family glycosyltransferase